MRNIKLTLSYDGTDFNGWQTQPGFRTVQETLENAIAALTGERVHANASGRTDSGVHAVGQVVNFYTNTHHPPEVAGPGPQRPPASRGGGAGGGGRPRGFRRQPRRPPQAVPLRDPRRTGARPVPAPLLLATRDIAWTRPPCTGRRRVCVAGTISAASRRTGPTACRACAPSRTWRSTALGDWIWLDVEADGFLYNMVRAIAGTLINVGRGYWPEAYSGRDPRRRGPDTGRPHSPGRGAVPHARDL